MLRPLFLGEQEVWGGEGEDHGAAMTPMPPHCEGQFGAQISSCVSSVRPCLVISFTRCPNDCDSRRCRKAWVSLPTPHCLQGLTMPPMQNPVSQGRREQLMKVAMQEYYRNTIDPAAYWPEKYWLARFEGTTEVPPVPLCHTGHIPTRLGG